MMAAMNRRTFGLGLSALAATVMSAPARAGEARVAIENFAFVPAELTVAAGTRVVWENRDDIPHLVLDAATPPGFKSSALDTGDRFGFVFAAPGRYQYFCALHPHMQATVVVR